MSSRFYFHFFVFFFYEIICLLTIWIFCEMACLYPVSTYFLSTFVCCLLLFKSSLYIRDLTSDHLVSQGP